MKLFIIFNSIETIEDEGKQWRGESLSKGHRQLFSRGVMILRGSYDTARECSIEVEYRDKVAMRLSRLLLKRKAREVH